jgi:hypothetical protein
LLVESRITTLTGLVASNWYMVMVVHLSVAATSDGHDTPVLAAKLPRQ